MEKIIFFTFIVLAFISMIILLVEKDYYALLCTLIVCISIIFSYVNRTIIQDGEYKVIESPTAGYIYYLDNEDVCKIAADKIQVTKTGNETKLVVQTIDGKTYYTLYLSVE